MFDLQLLFTVFTACGSLAVVYFYHHDGVLGGGVLGIMQYRSA